MLLDKNQMVCDICGKEHQMKEMTYEDNKQTVPKVCINCMRKKNENEQKG